MFFENCQGTHTCVVIACACLDGLKHLPPWYDDCAHLEFTWSWEKLHRDWFDRL